MSEASAFGSLTPRPDQSAHYLDGQSIALATYGGPTAAEKLYVNELNADFEPKINTRSDTHSAPYYLSDAGKIQFFRFDKPSEFYGKQACLVRNDTVKGIFVVRVPAGTPFPLLVRYKGLFEERQAAVDRQHEYQKDAPYIREREVGVNCGQATPPAQDPIMPNGNGGQDGFYDGATLNNIRQCQSLNSRNQVRFLGQNSGGYGRGFTSSFTLDGEENVAHAGDVGTAMHQEPTRRIIPSSNNGFGCYPSRDIILERAELMDLPPRHLDKKTNTLYKTEMCRNWNEVGDCRYGRSCQFAHGQKELRLVARHGQWKTKTCMAWLHGGCTYGSRCCYAHEVIPGGRARVECPNGQEPHGSPSSSEDSQSSLTDFFGGRGNHV